MPKKRLLPIVLLFALFALVIAYGSLRLTRDAAPPSDRPIVAATFHALADIVRHVAGDEADVRLLLPPGANPHTFDPSPSIVKAVGDAEVTYAIGHGIDGWIERLVEDSGTPLFVVDGDIALRASEDEGAHEEEEEDDHGEDGIDPHYWLTIPNARIIARNVAADLSARFPASSGAFARNLATYEATLDVADAEIRATLAGIVNRKVVTLHDAWYYFAEAYGLEIVGTFEPTAGREPSPRYLAELSTAAREAGVDVLYAEPGLPVAGIEPFVRDNGLRIVTLDPGEGSDPSSYVEIMIKNANTIRDNQ